MHPEPKPTVIRAARHTLALALRIAAEQYDRDAANHHGTPPARVYDRIAEQFRRQASTARQLAEQIEQAAVISLTD